MEPFCFPPRFLSSIQAASLIKWTTVSHQIGEHPADISRLFKLRYSKAISKTENNSKTNLFHVKQQKTTGSRSLKQTHLTDNPADIPGDAPALLLRADHLYDTRVIAALINLQEDIILYSQGGMAVAIRTAGKNVPTLLEALSRENMETFSNIKKYTLKDLQLGIQQNLKKKEPPYILLISCADREALEWELFAGSYKGVTDLVTKWLWPIPAFWATHLCVCWKITPNQVTLFSLLLAIFAGVAFWHGYYASGLITGWLMTFLDT